MAHYVTLSVAKGPEPAGMGPSTPLKVTIWGVPNRAGTDYNLVTRGRLASTGMKKKLQRAQVQSPGKTVWNVSTANTELALAA
jgi:hypothetical protein